jgi:hypothetical protein
MGISVLRQEWNRVETDDTHYSISALAEMCASRNRRIRLRALLIMRKQLDKRSARRYLGLARHLVEDRNNTCRWQALIVVGESVRTNPEAVWRVVAKYGGSRDRDMRTAIATVLLEHLLEYHFRRYFPRVKRRILHGDAQFADTLRMCWAFGQADRRKAEIRNLLERRGSAARLHG